MHWYRQPSGSLLSDVMQPEQFRQPQSGEKQHRRLQGSVYELIQRIMFGVMSRVGSEASHSSM